MKRVNIWHIIWIVGIYLTLVCILYLVVLYKVKWEDRDLNTYLYFYNCNNNICTSQTKPDTYYSNILCGKKNCPYIIDIKGNLVILDDDGNNFAYNYINETINNKYKTYRFTNDDAYIVTNQDNLYGVISSNGAIIVDTNYNYIKDYKNNFIIYKENDKYGIIGINNTINIEPQYNDAVLINAALYGYKLNDKYYIASYAEETSINNATYDYLYASNGIIFAINDKTIDILNENLQTQLLIKIDTFYEYKNIAEINTLDIYVEDNLLYFNVYDGQNLIKYIYDIKNKRII